MDSIMLYLLKGPCSSLLRSSATQLNNEDDELFTAIKKKKSGKKKNSLAAQWLVFHTFSEGAQVWPLVMELGSHKPQSTGKNKIKNKLKKKRNLVNKLICRFCYRFPFEETMLGKHFYSNCKKVLFSTKNSNILK